ncbi:MAG: hypothetical protein ACXAEX_23805, partial [Promethearchaeota archaeon]
LKYLFYTNFKTLSRKEMSQNWYKVAEKALGSGDTIQRSYPGSLDGNNGYLSISKNRLIFVKVKGFLSKKYNVIMNLPISEISEIKPSKRFELEISSSDTKYKMNTGDFPARIVLRGLDEFRPKVAVS